MNRVRRTALSLGVLLVLGVATTLGVATWVANVEDAGTETHASKTFPLGGGWVELQSWGRITLVRWRDRGSDPSSAIDDDPSLQNFIVWDSCGWPWRCMGHGIQLDRDGLSLYRAIIVRRGARRLSFYVDTAHGAPSFPGMGSVIVPLAVHWPRFGLNVIAWTATWSLLWFWGKQIGKAPLWIRRTVRRNRGRCEACGYPRTASGPVCPECGSSYRG